MAPRAIASVTVSFGLVSIPVKLYTPTRSEAKIRFDMLHGGGCGGRLKQKYICLNDGEEVSRKDTVKGYEYAKDKFVIISDEEVAAVAAQATQVIEITEFIPLNKVDLMAALKASLGSKTDDADRKPAKQAADAAADADADADVPAKTSAG